MALPLLLMRVYGSSTVAYDHNDVLVPSLPTSAFRCCRSLVESLRKTRCEISCDRLRQGKLQSLTTFPLLFFAYKGDALAVQGCFGTAV
jgi:hypothetical protein